MALLLAEDKAIKNRLQGITVTDLKNASRPVKVWFRDPQKEIRESEFPYITIHFTGMSRDGLREHRNPIEINYIPDGLVLDNDPNTKATADYPIPLNLTYSIVTHARNPMHDRQIHGAMMAATVIPFRYGWLEVDEDNTFRRVDLEGVQSADVYDQNGRVIFRKVYNIVVSSEVWVDDIVQTRKVDTVTPTVSAKTPEFNEAQYTP